MAVHAETADNLGLIRTVRNRKSGFLISLYHSDEAGIEDDLSLPYSLVCEEHDTCICFSAKRTAAAFLAHPEEWCADCQVAS